MNLLGNQSVASLIRSILTIGWWLLAICIALLSGLLLVSWTGIMKGEQKNMFITLPVTVQLSAPIQLVGSADTARQTNANLRDVRATLRLPAQAGAFLTAHLASGVAVMAALLWGLTQLRGIFQSLSQGIVFTLENVARIRSIGWIVILGEIVRALLGAWWSYYARSNFTADGVQFVTVVDFSLATILYGVIILVVAEVFSEGTRLYQEQSLTI